MLMAASLVLRTVRPLPVGDAMLFALTTLAFRFVALSRYVGLMLQTSLFTNSLTMWLKLWLFIMLFSTFFGCQYIPSVRSSLTLCMPLIRCVNLSGQSPIWPLFVTLALWSTGLLGWLISSGIGFVGTRVEGNEAADKLAKRGAAGERLCAA